MAKDESEHQGIDYGGEEMYISPEEMAVAEIRGEQKAVRLKEAYEKSPQFKIRKYVTPMRSFTKDVLGFVKKIPRYEEQAKQQYGKLKSEVSKITEEERKIERDLSQTLGGEATKGKTAEDWSMGFSPKPTEKTALPKKPAKKGEDWSGLDFKDMKF